MAASTTRRISQPNSRYRACIKISSLKKTRSRCDHHRLRSLTRASTAARLHSQPKSKSPVGSRPHRLRRSFENNIAQRCHRLRRSTHASTAAKLHSRPESESPVGGQPPSSSRSFENNIAQRCHRLRRSTRASTAAKLLSRPKSESPVGARSLRLRSLIRATTPRATLRQQVAACRTSRRATAPLALLHPRKYCRETLFAAKIRKPGRCPDRTACAVLPATSCLRPAIFPPEISPAEGWS